MSQQYPGPQQPYHQPYQGPAPYQPPPPPKKGMSAWAIVGITLGGIFAFLIVLGIAVGGGESSSDASDKTTAAAPEKPAEEPAEEDADAKPAENKQPAVEPKPARPQPKSYPEGDYVVGEDIPAGTYTTPGAKAGAFEFCSVTTEPTGDAKFPQLKSANAGERIIITLTKADGVVTIQGCEPLTLRR